MNARQAPRPPAGEARSETLLLAPPALAPSEDMRLPLAWHQRQAERLREAIGGEDEAVLLTDPWNIVHFTGLWAATTERPLYALLEPGRSPFWVYPRLDRELVTSWWYEDGYEYFDFPHVSGQLPHEGSAQVGPREDLWARTMVECARRGYDWRRLRVDRSLSPAQQEAAAEALGGPVESVADQCLALRMRKTDEELALIRRAYAYFDDVHCYARDLLLGSWREGMTDFDLRTEMTRYVTKAVAADLGPDRRPHVGVGISVDLGWVRAGAVTGYPHPNQLRYAPILPGEALQVSGVLRLAGYGGECYRPYLMSPRTEGMERLWRVVRDTCLLEQELLRPGVSCGEVAAQLHRFQIDAGMSEHIYHRPAHGQGPEGHQPPWVALGDDTVLEPGMCLSVEPGLYDPQAGFSVNFSDMFVVQAEGPALQMSRVPWTEEWCWLDLPQSSTTI